MLSFADGSLATISSEDLDHALVQMVPRESSGYTLDVLKNRLRPRDAVETTPRGDEYVVLAAVSPNTPCHASNPDVASECGLSELPRSIHFDDETDHVVFFIQTCVEEVETSDNATPQKPLFSMRREEPLDEQLDPRSRLREHVDSKKRVVAKRLYYATPTRSSWPLKQRSMGDISKLKEDLEHKITTWHTEVDLKFMKSLWGAHVKTPRKMNSQRNAYANPHERDYAVTGHKRRSSGTYHMPFKG